MRGAPGDDCVSGNLNRYASHPAANAHELVTSGGESALQLSRALFATLYVLYALVALGSAAGLAPLRSRATALLLLALSLLGGALCARLSRRGLPSQRLRTVSEPDRGSLLEHLGRLAFAAGLIATLAVLVLALLLPVGAYDALGYRLPAMAQWLDHGALHWVEGDDPLRNGYPLALEAIAAVLFRALDSAAAVDAIAPLFVLAGALALAGFAREVGALRSAALLSAGLFLLVPMHLLNAPSGYADAAFAGALVALLIAGARFATHAHVHGALLFDFGVGLALTMALKPHGFAFAGITLAGALFARLRWAPGGQLARQLASLLALLAPGLYFAARNVAMKGNPLYPLEVRAFGRVWLKGEAPLDGILTPDFNVPRELAAWPAALRPFWVWLQPHGPARTFDDRLAGFGYAFLLVGLPALAWLAVQCCRKEPAERDALRAVGFVLVLTLACWLLQPLSFWPRFSSWIWGAAALAIALLVTHLAASSGRAVLVTSLVLALVLPEALFALAHVKGLARLGYGVLREPPTRQLARVAGIRPAFVESALADREDVCRTPWRLGTDDANIDGVVAQLRPRPRMHVVEPRDFSELASALRARGCSELIAIGDNPLLARVPRDFVGNVRAATAFGRCHVISLSSALGVAP